MGKQPKTRRKPKPAMERGTKEALQHRPVLADTIEGQKVCRACDTLDILLRRGSITPAEYRAGRYFQTYFDKGQLQGVRAVRLDAVGRSTNPPGPEAYYAARDEVWQMLECIGGTTGTLASILWQVVGERYSFNDILKAQGGQRSAYVAFLKAGLEMLTFHGYSELGQPE